MLHADIRLVVGTRPEAIKLEPLARALRNGGFRPSIVFTGQHAGLNPNDFGLGDYRSNHLHCAGQANPHDHVLAVSTAMQRLFATKPDVIVVQGDTSSAMGAAQAGFALGIPVAHVEAGLRSFDRQLPWPEEDYRVAIDARAHLLFAPTDLSARNLRSEMVGGEIHVTGNTGIDALLMAERRLPVVTAREPGPPHILVTCHRRESWGDGLMSIATAILELASAGHCAFDFLLHPNASVRAHMKSLLAGVSGVRLLEPCGHVELLARLRDADLVLSDSGGIQEEAPAFGVPLLILREKTERPEGIASGNSILVGTSTARIVSEVRRLLRDPLSRAAMSRKAMPFGDGHAAPRIATIISEWCAGRVLQLAG